MMLSLAFRNVMEHRRKTLTVGGLMALALALLIIGSSIMTNLNDGMARSFTEQFTGDVFIYPEQPTDVTVFGSQSPGEVGRLAALSGYPELADTLTSVPGVNAISAQQVGMAQVDNQRGTQSFSFLWGVDPEHYQDTFNQPVEILDGGFWEAGEAGMLLNETVAEALGDDGDRPVQIGDRLLLTSQGDAGTKIREVTVTGLFRFTEQASPQLDRMSLVSDAIAQPLLALSDAEDAPVELTEQESRQLGSVSEDGLFGNGALTEAATDQAVAPVTVTDDAPTEPAVTTLDPATLWHFALVSIDDDANPAEVLDALRTVIDENDLDWTVADWKTGAGMVAELAGITQWVLNGMFLIIGLVSVIIIMNTLVISVTERMTEIGTMRALGAQKGFVRRLILSETLVIGGLAGGIGLAMGAAVLAIVNQVGLTPPAGFFEILFGGSALHPTLSAMAVVKAMVLILGTSMLASLYPIAIALRVPPVRAMQA